MATSKRLYLRLVKGKTASYEKLWVVDLVGMTPFSVTQGQGGQDKQVQHG
jgi:hypothetical protein